MEKKHPTTRRKLEQERRGNHRAIIDAGLILADASGRLLDGRAKLHNLSRDGFLVQTRVQLALGSKVTFAIPAGREPSIRGTARIVWVRGDAWAGWAAGAHILKISWRDSRRLKALVRGGPGFDFVALTKNALVAVYLAVVVTALHNIAFHQRHVRYAIAENIPVLAALAVMGLCLKVLLRRWK